MPTNILLTHIIPSIWDLAKVPLHLGHGDTASKGACVGHNISLGP